jgi:hypothetical protein
MGASELRENNHFSLALPPPQPSPASQGRERQVSNLTYRVLKND